MGDQRLAMELLAFSSERDLQLRAAVSGSPAAIYAVTSNPNLDDATVAWLMRHWAGDPDAADRAGAHASTITSEALRAAVIADDSPIAAHHLVRAHWVDPATAATLIERTGGEHLGEITGLLLPSMDPRRISDLDGALAAALVARWGRWWSSGDHSGWHEAGTRLAELGAAVRAAGLPWAAAPDPSLGEVGLTNWWGDIDQIGSAEYVIAAFDVLEHQACHLELATRILSGVADHCFAAQTPFLFVHAAQHHDRAHHDGGAASAAALEWAASTDTAAALGALLVAKLNPSFLFALTCDFLTAALAPQAGGGNLDRRALGAAMGAIERRCGTDTEAAIALLAGGFAGTVGELCDVATTESPKHRALRDDALHAYSTAFHRS